MGRGFRGGGGYRGPRGAFVAAVQVGRVGERVALWMECQGRGGLLGATARGLRAVAGCGFGLQQHCVLLLSSETVEMREK